MNHDSFIQIVTLYTTTSKKPTFLRYIFHIYEEIYWFESIWSTNPKYIYMSIWFTGKSILESRSPWLSQIHFHMGFQMQYVIVMFGHVKEPTCFPSHSSLIANSLDKLSGWSESSQTQYEFGNFQPSLISPTSIEKYYCVLNAMLLEWMPFDSNKNTIWRSQPVNEQRRESKQRVKGNKHVCREKILNLSPISHLVKKCFVKK